jgi:uncharacterized protein (UPF0548 family)
VFLPSRPSPDQIRAFISSQERKPFSYPEVGASRDIAPRGYNLDHTRIHLGNGRQVFEGAIKAIRQWKMFEMARLSLCWPGTRIEVGATVAVLVAHLGFWSLNSCRIVYLIDERGPVERFGFAYGTLTEHAEIGEERFSVEFHASEQAVWYDLYAFS